MVSPGQSDTLAGVLDAAAKAADRQIAALASVHCTETVVETKVNQKDKAEEHRRQAFDYLVMADTDDGDVAVTESRIPQSATGKAEAKPLLASTGFATTMLILHQYYQHSFEFKDLGLVEAGGRQWRKLAFEFQPGKRSPSVLRAGNREYPLAWKGEVLLDDATGRVFSIHAGLGSQLDEIGLVSLEATVRYGPAGSPELPEWLPVEAVIDLKTAHQHWRNVHTFSDYKRFAVTTSEKVETGK
jgi:hypothetical protein